MRVVLEYSLAPWSSACSFVSVLGVFRFILDRPWGDSVHSGSLGSFNCALEVAWFNRFCWID